MGRFLFSAQGWPYLLTPFIALAVILELAHASPTPVSYTHLTLPTTPYV